MHELQANCPIQVSNPQGLDLKKDDVEFVGIFGRFMTSEDAALSLHTAALLEELMEGRSLE